MAVVLFTVPFSVSAQTTISHISIVQVTAVVGTGDVSNPGGGSSSGGGSTPPAGTDLTFDGVAYPGSMVTILKSGVAVISQPAESNGSFHLLIPGVIPGTYNFSILAKDSSGRISNIQTYTVLVLPGVSMILNGIFLPPTISADQSTVRQGELLRVKGTSAPGAIITLSSNTIPDILMSAIADVNGEWHYELDTSLLKKGTYTLKAASTVALDHSPDSTKITFIVGAATIPVITRNIHDYDLNGDSHVNLIDFSILAYWYHRAEPPAKTDFNDDGKVDLIDFSILAYNWTG